MMLNPPENPAAASVCVAVRQHAGFTGMTSSGAWFGITSAPQDKMA